ncbi:hypothetical protein [Streptomyces sp. TR06-5]|uniref:hypothetical protein n=1 Tax=unclassified Streptomyces TaxID=2593676 RepID=UPI0039A3919C
MSQGLNADPTELRASAGACDDIAHTMKEPADKAIKEADTAGGSLTGWSIGAALGEIAASWKPALDGLHARTRAAGDNLRSCAKNHDWNEQRASQNFEETETETNTQAAPGSLPSPLQHGIVHPVAPATGSPDFDPTNRLLDPQSPHGTNMPTYDDSLSTHPTPGISDFG